MSETERLALPMVQAAQAQKHVTVNAALRRLDGLVQLTLQSTGATTPPTAVSGAWAVPDGAVNAWSGREGQIAIAANGGWEFAAPEPGWRAWVVDEGESAVFDGAVWRGAQQTLTPAGAGLQLRSFEFEHSLSSGPVSTTAPGIPAQTVVFGVTGRVLSEITGSATAFSVGIEGESPTRYGSGFGVSAGAWLRGLTGAPVTYYSDTALALTAEGGTFSGGVVRLCVHGLQLSLPSG